MAFEELLKKAEQGDAEAQYELANHYYDCGEEQDLDKAVEWYTKSAELGNEIAKNVLWDIYWDGEKIKQDLEKATHWYIQAAEQGDKVAQFRLGCLYFSHKDEYGDLDYSQVYQAIDMLEKSVEQGYAEAQYALAICYMEGAGVDEDLDKAIELLEKSAAQGYEEAQGQLEDCYEMAGEAQNKNTEQKPEKIDNHMLEDIKKAQYWSEKAEQGDAIAQCRLGECYFDGIGFMQDYDKAFDWYEKSAKQGNADAQNSLAECYLNGVGVEQDYTKAIEWFTKAAEQDDTQSQYYLGKIYYDGDRVAQDFSKAVYWLKKAAQYDNEAKQMLKDERLKEYLSGEK